MPRTPGRQHHGGRTSRTRPATLRARGAPARLAAAARLIVGRREARAGRRARVVIFIRWSIWSAKQQQRQLQPARSTL